MGHTHHWMLVKPDEVKLAQVIYASPFNQYLHDTLDYRHVCTPSRSWVWGVFVLLVIKKTLLTLFSDSLILTLFLRWYTFYSLYTRTLSLRRFRRLSSAIFFLHRWFFVLVRSISEILEFRSLLRFPSRFGVLSCSWEILCVEIGICEWLVDSCVGGCCGVR